VGRKHGHQWGENVAADGEKPMAIDIMPQIGHRFGDDSTLLPTVSAYPHSHGRNAGLQRGQATSEGMDNAWLWITARDPKEHHLAGTAQWSGYGGEPLSRPRVGAAPGSESIRVGFAPSRRLKK